MTDTKTEAEPEAAPHCRNCAVGACCDCGSLSPWRCGCDANGDEDDDEDGE